MTLVLVPECWVDRAYAFARAKLESYATGGSPRSLSRSGNRGVEKNGKWQAQGKIGEAAIAICFELDPETAVDWTIRDGAPGWDVKLPNGELADVKTTPRPELIWSKDSNDLYHKKQFDILIAVTLLDLNIEAVCRVDGWITKAEFFERKLVADGSGRLQAGTWFVWKHTLRSILS